MIPQPVNRPINDKMYENVMDYPCPIEPFTVPAGFQYDVASVPWVATGAVPKDGLIRAAALCHDYLCVNKGQVPRNDGEGMLIYDWTESADIFRRLMLDAGIDKERAATAYQAVMLYGVFKSW